MSPYSVGLETEVYLSPMEKETLRSSILEGKLQFREVNENAHREIPFEIRYDPSQKELLEVKVNPPHTYFGDAEKITFNINEEFYEKLSRLGSSGDRFWNSGKLLLFVNNDGSSNLSH